MSSGARRTTTRSSSAGAASWLGEQVRRGSRRRVDRAGRRRAATRRLRLHSLESRIRAVKTSRAGVPFCLADALALGVARADPWLAPGRRGVAQRHPVARRRRHPARAGDHLAHVLAGYRARLRLAASELALDDATAAASAARPAPGARRFVARLRRARESASQRRIRAVDAARLRRHTARRRARSRCAPSWLGDHLAVNLQGVGGRRSRRRPASFAPTAPTSA